MGGQAHGVPVILHAAAGAGLHVLVGSRQAGILVGQLQLKLQQSHTMALTFLPPLQHCIAPALLQAARVRWAAAARYLQYLAGQCQQQMWQCS